MFIPVDLLDYYHRKRRSWLSTLNRRCASFSLPEVAFWWLCWQPFILLESVHHTKSQGTCVIYILIPVSTYMDTNPIHSIWYIICSHKETLYGIKELDFCQGEYQKFRSLASSFTPFLYYIRYTFKCNLFGIPYIYVWYQYTGIMNVLPL